MKVCNLSEAVSSIPAGAHVALSGFAIARCTMAFAREAIRQGLRGHWEYLARIGGAERLNRLAANPMLSY